jgi:hypothetical protein
LVAPPGLEGLPPGTLGAPGVAAAGGFVGWACACVLGEALDDELPPEVCAYAAATIATTAAMGRR